MANAAYKSTVFQEKPANLTEINIDRLKLARESGSASADRG